MKLHLNSDEWLELNIDSTGIATIKSSLKYEEPVDGDDARWNTSIDAIESLILAHFCAGVDVFGPTYREGIQTTLSALENQIYG